MGDVIEWPMLSFEQASIFWLSGVHRRQTVTWRQLSGIRMSVCYHSYVSMLSYVSVEIWNFVILCIISNLYSQKLEIHSSQTRTRWWIIPNSKFSFIWSFQEFGSKMVWVIVINRVIEPQNVSELIDFENVENALVKQGG